MLYIKQLRPPLNLQNLEEILLDSLTLQILHQVELHYLHNHVISGHRQYISCLWFCTFLA